MSTRPPWRRRPARRDAPTARTATIARVIDKLTAQLGRAPTDAEVAALLATHVSHVQRHRAIIGR